MSRTAMSHSPSLHQATRPMKSKSLRFGKVFRLAIANVGDRHRIHNDGGALLRRPSIRALPDYDRSGYHLRWESCRS
jgi:hypothetical protein